MVKQTRTKILFTIPNFITAGSGQLLLDIAERLDRTRFEPHICVLKRGGRLEQRIEELGIPLVERPFTVPARPLSTLPRSVRRAARSFRNEHYDIWHSFHYAADYTEPLIARASGAKAWIYSKKNMSWRERAWKLRSLFATRIVTLNTDMSSQFFNHALLRNKVRFIPPGVDIDAYSPSVPPRLNLRSSIPGISEEDKLIGCVAHLVPVKGHEYLIEAIAHVPNAHLLLAGRDSGDEYTSSLKRRVTEIGLADRVHFLGDVHDIPALHAELDLFALPTVGRGEGCPVALIEGIACGTPCVATDIPGSRDVIEHGVSGWLVPPEDMDGLVQALTTVLESRELRSSLSANGRKRAVECYSIEHEVERHEALYHEVMGRN